tara:strand:- start:34 stop:459 length:426 start_codon:yes stop_codon:yes gene_type:complete
MSSPGEVESQWQNKWVKLSYSDIGMNQLNVTKYQVITKLTFRGFTVFSDDEYLIRSGHPCKEDAKNNNLSYIGDLKWTRATVKLEFKLALDDDDKKWKLMRETEMMGFEIMQAIDIEEFDMSTLDSSMVMPPPDKSTRIKF